MMKKSARLLTILNHIRSRGNLSAVDLADRCNVTERTIYRDINDLAEAGAPIYYENGYKLLGGTFLPPLNLTQDEYIILKVALMATPLTSVDSERLKVNNLLSKIDSAINITVTKPEKEKELRQLIDSKTTMDLKHCQPILQILKVAVDLDNRVEFNYRSLNGESTSRRVDPYFIVFRGHAYYLIGYCHLREAMRLFRLDRIVKIKITDKQFRRDPNMTPQYYFQFSWELFNGEPIDVKIKLTGVAAEVVKTGKRHDSEQVKLLDTGEVEYSVTVAGLDEITRWIVGFGGDAEVIEPKSLKIKVKKCAEEILQSYHK